MGREYLCLVIIITVASSMISATHLELAHDHVRLNAVLARATASLCSLSFGTETPNTLNGVRYRIQNSPILTPASDTPPPPPCTSTPTATPCHNSTQPRTPHLHLDSAPLKPGWADTHHTKDIRDSRGSWRDSSRLSYAPSGSRNMVHSSFMTI